MHLEHNDKNNCQGGGHKTETHTQSQEESPNWVVNENEMIFHCTIKGHTCLHIKTKNN